MTAKRTSIRPTYDSRETGPRYHVTVRVNGETVIFEKRVDDPFIRQEVRMACMPWRWLPWPCRKHTVTVIVGADPDVIEDVMELDGNYLGANCSRRDAFNSHLMEAATRMAPREDA